MEKNSFDFNLQLFGEGGDGGSPGNGGQSGSENTGGAFTQADLDRIVGERLAREREKYKDHDSIKAELEKLKQGQMTETEKLNARIKELEARNVEAEGKVKAVQVKELKEIVLTKLGLPTSWAGRIAGEDEKAIEADAKELQKLLGVDKVGGATNPTNHSNGNAGMNAFIRRAAGR